MRKPRAAAVHSCSKDANERSSFRLPMPNRASESRRWTQRRTRQRKMLHWAQGGICASCGRTIGASGNRPRTRPTYPTFDHVISKNRGGHRVLINGLLEHRNCNEMRDDLPPTGCDRVWQMVVIDRLASEDAKNRWGVILSERTFQITDASMRTS